MAADRSSAAADRASQLSGRVRRLADQALQPAYEWWHPPVSGVLFGRRVVADSARDLRVEGCAHDTGAVFHGIIGANLWPGACRFVFIALRYYWITAKGYRLRPWRSPYIRWRMETFFGREAESAHDARGFFRLMWRERARMRRFLRWVGERWHEQARRRRRD